MTKRNTIAARTFGFSIRWMAVTAALCLASLGLKAQWPETGYRPIDNRLTYFTSHAGMWFGSDGANMYRSTDDGLTWQEMDNGPSGPKANVVSIHSLGSTLFASSHQRLYASDDNGSTWYETGYTQIMRQMASTGTALFGIDYGVVLKSTDNGMTWTEVTPAVGLSYTSLLAVGPRVVVTTSSGEIFVSDNQGNTWNEVAQLAEYLMTLSAVGNHLFATSLYAQTFHSIDAGSTWNPLTTPFQSHNMYAIDGVLYAASGAVYVSSDEGSNWTEVTTGAIFDVYTFVAVGNGGAVLFKPTDEDIKYSNDDGQTWSDRDGEPLRPAIQSQIARGSTLLASTYFGTLRSADAGATWAQVGPADFAIALEIHGSTFFAGFLSGGVFHSLDDGITWVQLNSQLDFLSINDLEFVNSILLAATNDGLYRSTDFGVSWTQVALDNQNVMYVVTTDDQAASYAFVEGLGTFRSTNQGLSWTQINSSDFGFQVREMICVGSRLFAGTFNGIYELNTVNIWTPISSTLNSKYIHTMATDGSNLFFAIDNENAVRVFVDNTLQMVMPHLTWMGVTSLMAHEGILYAGVSPFNGMYTGGQFVVPITPYLSVASVQPAQATVGSTITIFGNNFDANPAGNQVMIGNLYAQVVSASVTELQVIVPNATGTVMVNVTANHQSASSTSTFRILPSLTSFAPASGPIGTQITITGAGFDQVTVPIVRINGFAAGVNGNEPNQIQCAVLAGTTSGSITVISDGVTLVSATPFQITPLIASFSPTSGMAGTTVTILGSGFDVTPANNQVLFNGTPAVVNFATLTSLAVTVPAGVTSGSVRVTTSGGTSLSNVPFLALPLPSHCYYLVPKPVITVMNLGGPGPTLRSSSPSGNQWFNLGTAIPGATAQDLEVAAAGEYAVQVLLDGCPSEVSDPVILVVTALETGVKETQVYPNPAEDVLYIGHGRQPEDRLTYEITSSLWQTALTGETERATPIPVDGLPPGLYVIQWRDSSGRISRARFVKR